MDISDGYNYQQQQQQQQEIQNNVQQQQQQQQNDMQCDPIYPGTNSTGTTTITTTTAAAAAELMATEQMNCMIETDMPVTLGCANAPPATATQQLAILPAPQQQQQISSDVDVDSLLLQQFSCLGTTDHEDLINQFRALLNHETTKDSAKFFLEMSNWNLQAAIGCYLDYFNGQQLPCMKVVLEARPTEGQQAWRIRNEGNESWPNGCYLISPGQDKRVDVPALRSGECCDIIADIPPTHPTMCVWRLCTPYGSYFGDAIIMVGWKDSQKDITEGMTQLFTSTPTVDTSMHTTSNCDSLQVKVVRVIMD